MCMCEGFCVHTHTPLLLYVVLKKQNQDPLCMHLEYWHFLIALYLIFLSLYIFYKYNI